MNIARSRETCEIAERLVPQALRSHAWRRSFVVLGNVLGLATVVAALFDLGDAAGLLGIAASVCCAFFYGAILGPEGLMDEQEYVIRDRAHRQAYLLAGFVFFPLALLTAAFAPERDGVQVLWAFTAAVVLFLSLPSAIVAWALPDKRDA